MFKKVTTIICLLSVFIYAKSLEEELAGRYFDINGYFFKYNNGSFDWIYVTPDKSFLAKLDGIKNGYFLWKRIDIDKFTNIYVDPQKKWIEFGNISSKPPIGNPPPYNDLYDILGKLFVFKYYINNRLVLNYIELSNVMESENYVNGVASAGFGAVCGLVNSISVPYQYFCISDRKGGFIDTYILNIDNNHRISGNYAYINTQATIEEIIDNLLKNPDAVLYDSYVSNSNMQIKNIENIIKNSNSEISSKELNNLLLKKDMEQEDLKSFKHTISNLIQKL